MEMDDEDIFIKISDIVEYWAYLKTIDWFDPWLILLIIAHLTIITVVAMTRKHSLFQMILFLTMLLAVFMSEKINELATKHSRLFSRQQIDSSGLFISTVFSMPILLNCMLMIVNWLYTATDVMSTMRAAQMKNNSAGNSRSKSNNNKITNKKHL
ncbi:transmembrane protein 18-like [Sitodiplosis mosellana]|uniref:transmembrane protein 18-like n=1 Tax=Sitodiplosis mosellana TaxID=263140 RepID=UPI002444BCE7|nr:transmembrane protein 18-like [Sitodiplosis mosellana]